MRMQIQHAQRFSSNPCLGRACGVRHGSWHAAPPAQLASAQQLGVRSWPAVGAATLRSTAPVAHAGSIMAGGTSTITVVATRARPLRRRPSAPSAAGAARRERRQAASAACSSTSDSGVPSRPPSSSSSSQPSPFARRAPYRARRLASSTSFACCPLSSAAPSRGRSDQPEAALQVKPRRTRLCRDTAVLSLWSAVRRV